MGQIPRWGWATVTVFTRNTLSGATVWGLTAWLRCRGTTAAFQLLFTSWGWGDSVSLQRQTISVRLRMVQPARARTHPTSQTSRVHPKSQRRAHTAQTCSTYTKSFRTEKSAFRGFFPTRLPTPQVPLIFFAVTWGLTSSDHQLNRKISLFMDSARSTDSEFFRSSIGKILRWKSFVKLKILHAFVVLSVCLFRFSRLRFLWRETQVCSQWDSQHMPILNVALLPQC